MNIRFQNAVNNIEQDVPPIWFMRQAGRYQESYRKLREKHSFVDLCKTPELSAKVGFNAVDEFDFDLCILFSDILFPLEALGMGLSYDPAPNLEWRLDTKKDFEKMIPSHEAFEHMLFQAECLKATREEIPKDKSLIGFVGGLWTLFGYATEGSHKGNMIETKKRIPLFKPFVDEFLYPLIEKNIELQLKNHSEVVMIFDTALGEVSPVFFKTEIFPYIKRLAQKFPKKIGYYSKGTTADYFTEEFYTLPFAGVGWDHRWDLISKLKNPYGGFVQGNFDQSLLHQEFDDFKQSFKNYVTPFTKLTNKERQGWVSGLGHGVLPKTPEDHVKYFVDEIRKNFEGGT